jgi:hypothetical protein
MLTPGASSVSVACAVFLKNAGSRYPTNRVVVRQAFSPKRGGHFRAGMPATLQQPPYAVPSCDRVSNSSISANLCFRAASCEAVSVKASSSASARSASPSSRSRRSI